jgi:hypothetical protein
MEYIIKDFEIERRIAGTSIEIVLNFPAILPLSDVTAVKFGLFDSQYLLVELALGNGITITGQELKIKILPTITEGKEGFCDFEIRLTKPSGKVAGRGIVHIVKSLFD